MDSSWPPSLVPFQHRALTADREFRLVKFAPVRRWQGTLSCEVHHFRLSDHPPYTALSYTSESVGWSEQADVIRCDNRHLQVPMGLTNILHRIVSGYDPVYVWVDQLCIRQDDPVEKAEQIRLMKDIYKNASETIIWLGDARDRPELLNGAFVLLRQIHFRLSHIGDRNIFQHTVENTFPQQSFGTPQEQATLASILHRPWFSRVWVLQEATLSSNAVVHCGSNRIPWNDFCDQIAGLARINVLDYFIKHLDASTYDSWHSRHLLFVALYALFLSIRDALRTSDQHAEFPKLKHMLHISRCMNAKDQRDRIYAVLGLCSDADRVNVSYLPSYSVGCLFYDVALYFLSDSSSACDCKKLSCPSKQLSILGDAGMRNLNDACFAAFSYPEKQALRNLPSWVPIWVKTGPNSLWFNAHNAGYDASGDTAPLIHIDSEGTCSQRLHLVGTVSDEVYICSRPFPNLLRDAESSPNVIPPMRLAFQVTSMGRWIHEVFNLTQQNIPESDPPSRTENFCRTLCANTTHMESSCLEVIPQRTPITDGRALVRDFQDYMSVYSFMADNIQQPQIMAANWTALRCYEQGMDKFVFSSIFHVTDRTFFITNTGRTGIGPANIQRKDVVCIFAGAPIPLVLRPTDTLGQYRLV
ncbi:hypothetical protein ABHI18_007769, partial [Aspergillus niger]